MATLKTTYHAIKLENSTLNDFLLDGRQLPQGSYTGGGELQFPNDSTELVEVTTRNKDEQCFPRDTFKNTIIFSQSTNGKNIFPQVYIDAKGNEFQIRLKRSWNNKFKKFLGLLAIVGACLFLAYMTVITAGALPGLAWLCGISIILNGLFSLTNYSKMNSCIVNPFCAIAPVLTAIMLLVMASGGTLGIVVSSMLLGWVAYKAIEAIAVYLVNKSSGNPELLALNYTVELQTPEAGVDLGVTQSSEPAVQPAPVTGAPVSPAWPHQSPTDTPAQGAGLNPGAYSGSAFASVAPRTHTRGFGSDDRGVGAGLVSAGTERTPLIPGMSTVSK